MQHPGLVEKIMEKAMPEMRTRLSVKCRLGYASQEEIFELMPVFNRFELTEIIIHARLGIQVYKGNVDMASFAALQDSTGLPLVYNGDVFEKNDIAAFQQITGPVDRWMIGRGLLVDPFLPGDIKNRVTATAYERKTVIRKFMDDLYYGYRKSLNDRLHTIHILKELWEYLAFGFDHPREVFNTVKKTTTFDQYEDAVHEIFDRYVWLGAEGRQFRSSMFQE